MNEFLALYISLQRQKRLLKTMKAKMVRTQISLGASAYKLGYKLKKEKA